MVSLYYRTRIDEIINETPISLTVYDLEAVGRRLAAARNKAIKYIKSAIDQNLKHNIKIGMEVEKIVIYVNDIDVYFNGIGICDIIKDRCVISELELIYFKNLLPINLVEYTKNNKRCFNLEVNTSEFKKILPK